MLPAQSYATPQSTPFTIRTLSTTTYLVRETDKYGEYPNIYVTLVPYPGTSKIAFFVISDTGCGTSSGEHNLATFLESTVNPGGQLPYLVITTHCHYDHILGLRYLPSTSTGRTTVVSSSHKKSFIVPSSNLVKHSLCEYVGETLPQYSVTWVKDKQRLVYSPPPTSAYNLQQREWFYTSLRDGAQRLRTIKPTKPEDDVAIDTGIIILHTPGHTPDSLTWYNIQERYISVGDSLYERESPDTKAAGEPPMPTIFGSEGDLLDWWDSLEKVIAFVRERNNEDIDDPLVSGENIFHATTPSEEAFGNTTRLKAIETFTCNPTSDRDSVIDVHENDEEEGWVSVSTCRNHHQQPPIASRKKPRVRLGAAHVTVDVDAEDCLLEMQAFMRSVLRDEIPSCSLGPQWGEETRLWDEMLGDDEDKESEEEAGDDNQMRTRATKGRFSVQAPSRLIHEAREGLPREAIWG